MGKKGQRCLLRLEHLHSPVVLLPEFSPPDKMLSHFVVRACHWRAMQRASRKGYLPKEGSYGSRHPQAEKVASHWPGESWWCSADGAGCGVVNTLCQGQEQEDILMILVTGSSPPSPAPDPVQYPLLLFLLDSLLLSPPPRPAE